jgi:hypothetical protein
MLSSIVAPSGYDGQWIVLSSRAVRKAVPIHDWTRVEMVDCGIVYVS